MFCCYPPCVLYTHLVLVLERDKDCRHEPMFRTLINRIETRTNDIGHWEHLSGK